MLFQTASFHSFNGWVIFICIHVPHLYPFLCWWTFRLLPCSGCCKQCCNEHWYAWIVFFSGYMLRSGIVRSHDNSRASQVTLVVKNLPANAEDIRDKGSIPGSGRFPGGGHGNPFQYSCLENPMDRGARWATVHGVAKDRTALMQLSTGPATQYCRAIILQLKISTLEKERMGRKMVRSLK